MSFLGEFLEDKCGNADTLALAALTALTECHCQEEGPIQTTAVASGEASVLRPHSLSSAGDGGRQSYQIRAPLATSFNLILSLEGPPPNTATLGVRGSTSDYLGGTHTRAHAELW